MLIIKVIFHYSYCVNITKLGRLFENSLLTVLDLALFLLKKGRMIQFDLIFIYHILFENGF